VTSLSTRLQEHLRDEVRGRVMALYMMGFGGTIPLGLLVAGQVAAYTSITTVVAAGAIVAMALATNAVRLGPYTARTSTRSPSSPNSA